MICAKTDLSNVKHDISQYSIFSTMKGIFHFTMNNLPEYFSNSSDKMVDEII